MTFIILYIGGSGSYFVNGQWRKQSTWDCICTWILSRNFSSTFNTIIPVLLHAILTDLTVQATNFISHMRKQVSFRNVISPPPSNQYYHPPMMCAFPTALLPSHKRLHPSEYSTTSSAVLRFLGSANSKHRQRHLKGQAENLLICSDPVGSLSIIISACSYQYLFLCKSIEKNETVQLYMHIYLTNKAVDSDSLDNPLILQTIVSKHIFALLFSIMIYVIK